MVFFAAALERGSIFDMVGTSGPTVGNAEIPNFTRFFGPVSIVAKKWDPGILDPSRFSGQIRKVEARLGKLAKIRKVETN